MVLIAEALSTTLLPVACHQRLEIDGGVIGDLHPNGILGILQVDPMVLVNRLSSNV